MAKKIKGPWNTHIRRDYPDQGFYESKHAYRQRKKREKEMKAFFRDTEKAVKAISRSFDQASSSKNNASYRREIEKLNKEKERIKLIEDAKKEYSNFQDWISSLSNSLLTRETDKFDWDSISFPRGEYKTKEFQPTTEFSPPQAPTEKSVKLEIISRHSRILIIILFLIASIIVSFLNFWIGLSWIFACIIFFVVDQIRLDKIAQSEMPAALRVATEEYNMKLQELSLEYQLKLEHEKIAHDVQEASNKLEWDKEEKARKRIRDSGVNEDFEILEEILLSEICKLDFPVDQNISAFFDSAESVNIEFQIPCLQEIPDKELSLAKTGKLSSKNMSVKKRVDLFEGLCTSLALRLAYEAFRIIPFLREIQIFGYSQSIDFATGGNEEIYPLFVSINRSELDDIDLDKIDPSIAFKHLDGAFQCDRKGNLSNIPDHD